MISIDDFLAKLDGVKKTGKGWSAKCPAHDDQHSSLTVKIGDKGNIIVKCHREPGCSFYDIAKALGIKPTDLSPERDKSATADKSKTVAEYAYVDEHGSPLFYVVRKEPKSFRQYHLDANGNKAWNMNGVRRVPYHLDELLKAVADGRDVFIVEGEKDADNLRKLGLAATCNSQGAGNWSDEHSAYLKGATGKITIIADRDSEKKNYPGQRHAIAVKDSLAKIGVTARAVYVPEGKGKDASDYIANGATAADFAALADADEFSPPWERADILTNYTVSTEKVSGKTKTVLLARAQADIVADLYAATGDWPRKVGDTIFAFLGNRANSDQRYLTLRNPPAMFSWIRDTLAPRWKCGNGGSQDENGINFVTMEQLYEAIRRTAKTYEGISNAPHWPLRVDQFYDYGELPPPSQGHRAFWELIDFFTLATDTYRLLAAALFCAPMYYRTAAQDDTPGSTPKPLPRPLWVIDTMDAQMSGKSSLAKKVASLYGSAAFDVDMSQLKRDADEIKKRLLSVDGRRKRVFFMDNVTGTIKDATLASWITASTLSGRAAYGHGDATRPNDFTFVLTVNGAELDTDTSSRAYTIKVKLRDTEYKPKTTDEYGNPRTWEPDVDHYIDTHRRQIQADIIDMIEHAKPRKSDERLSDKRFSDFDARVLSAVCQSDEEFEACRASIVADATGANVDAELVDNFTEAVENYLAQLPDFVSGYDPALPVMMSNAAVKDILDNCDAKLKDMTIKQLRTLLKAGLSTKFSRRFTRLAATYSWRKEAIVYGLDRIPDGATETAYQILDIVTSPNRRRSIERPTEPIRVATIR